MRTRVPVLLLSIAVLGALGACRDNERFSTRGGSFQGPVVSGSFVRAGVADGVLMCLTLDTDHLQDTPGTIATSDGRFQAAALRPIPQIWHDPLSTLSFGDGRVQNFVYAATPRDVEDVMVVVSLMQADTVEVRLVRGAPGADAGGRPAIFGVFTLDKRQEPCAF